MATQKLIHQMSAAQFDKAFPNEEACCAYLVSKRWPDGVKCPRCQSSKLTELKGNPWHWQCYACAVSSYRFSHITGTIFENTNKPLKDWFRVAHLMLTSKKGMSALQICRFMGFGSYKTAWYMCHRIRVAMQDGGFAKLMGEVEVDETYIGGKDRNRHWSKKSQGSGPNSKKVGVIGAIARKGNVVCEIIESTDRLTLSQFVRKTVDTRVSLVATDEAYGYSKLGQTFPHQAVNHARKEYVRGNVHTANLDSFWSLLKRGVMGTYQNVSKAYLPLYLAEFSFRHNNRKNANIFHAVVASC